MKTVSDILEGTFNPATGAIEQAPVAYILHRDHHEAVCPWCGAGLGDLTMPNPSTHGDLYLALLDRQVPHMATCPQRQATRYGVTIRRQ